jgi:branched-chain amino acid transport system permease protein
MLAVDLAIAGVAIGSVAAMAGIGLIVTYRTTGVLNIGFGAIAMIVAYLLWQAVQGWGIPLWPAALVDLLVVAPGIGILLDLAVFSPLQRRGASAVERLVASLGVFVLLVGLAVLVWGGNARTDAPDLLPTGVLRAGQVVIPWSTVAELGVVLVVAAAIWLVATTTRFGLTIRAVVDRRGLAELSGIDAARVSRTGWAAGAFLAGLAGVLLAPVLRLDPYGLTLVVLESMAVALVARLANLGVAIAAALVLGIAQSELTQIHLGGAAETMLQTVSTNLLAVALLVAVLVLPGFREAGAEDAGRIAMLSRRRDLPAIPGWWIPLAGLLLVPLGFTGTDLMTALRVPALAIIFVSLVLVTGYSGQISLGTAGFAGLGALLTARIATGGFPGLPALPALAALPLGVLIVVPVGLATGLPAIRRRGLLVMFSTFAVATVVSRFVFQQPWATNGLTVIRPGPFASDRGFYLLELACLGISLLFVRNLHVGRAGRGLLAVRDNEAGARAAGVNVGRLKVFVFAISAGLAAMGGALLVMGSRAFDPSAFDPLQGFLWFAAVVVFGVDSTAGAVLAAGLIVGLDASVANGMSTVVIGALALLLGYAPGGVAGLRALLPDLAAPGPVHGPVQPLRLTAQGRLTRRRIESDPAKLCSHPHLPERSGR